MNTARRVILLAAAALLLIGIAPQAAAQTPIASREFSATTGELFDHCVMELHGQVETWRAIAMTRPDEPIWNRLADDTQEKIDTLTATPIEEDDLANWWTGGPGALAAYYKGTIYLDDNFNSGGTLSQSEKYWNSLKQHDPKKYDMQQEELRQDIAGRASVLAHEALHADGNRSERDAYLFQYRYLVASDVPVTCDEMLKVQEQLVALGTLRKIGKTKGLDKKLGLEPIKKFHKEQELRMREMQREPTDVVADPEPKKPKRDGRPKPEEMKPDPITDNQREEKDNDAYWEALDRKAERLDKTPAEDVARDESTVPVLPVVGIIDAVFTVADAPAGTEPVRCSFELNEGRATARIRTRTPPRTYAPHSAHEGTGEITEFEGTVQDNIISGNLEFVVGPFEQWSLPGSTDKPWRKRHTYRGSHKGMTVVFRADGSATLSHPEGPMSIHTVILEGEPWQGKREFTTKSTANGMTLQGVWRHRSETKAN
jgi:hypothetical protein